MCRRLLAVVVLFVAGCCGTEFKVEDMQAKRLRSAFDTLDYFRYALRQSDWDAVYMCLSTETRKYIDDKFLGRTFYGTILAKKELEDFPGLAAPESLRHMKLVQLIHRAETLNIIEKSDARTLVTLYYESPEKKTDWIMKAIPLLLEKDEKGSERWTVAVAEWLEGGAQ